MDVLIPRLEVVGLPLNPSVRHKLQSAGFRTTADIAAVAGPVELATGTLCAGALCGSRPPGGDTRCQRSAPCRAHTSHLETHAEAQLTHEEALSVLQLAAPQRVAPAAAASHALSARQIFERELAARRIITFAAELDGILGGGVETGAVTEFWCGGGGG